MAEDDTLDSGTRLKTRAAPATSVLIIDDSEIARALLTRALSEVGFQVSARPTAVGAQAAMLRERPDIVLIDLSMPLMSGESLVRAARAKDELARTVFLLCSAEDPIRLAAAAEASGADGWVPKTDVEALVRTVIRWSLRRERMEQSVAFSRGE
jgi:DNA-binding response OmpR family regulator